MQRKWPLSKLVTECTKLVLKHKTQKHQNEWPHVVVFSDEWMYPVFLGASKMAPEIPRYLWLGTQQIQRQLERHAPPTSAATRRLLRLRKLLPWLTLPNLLNILVEKEVSK